MGGDVLLALIELLLGRRHRRIHEAGRNQRARERTGESDAVGSKRKDLDVVDPGKDINLAGDVLDFMQGLVVEDVADLDPQHQQQRLGAAVLVLKLAIEESVGMIGGEKVLELGTDLDACGPQRHECGNRNQRQSDRRAVLKNVLTEPRGLVRARSNHRLGRPRTAHRETPTQRVQTSPLLTTVSPKIATRANLPGSALRADYDPGVAVRRTA